MITREEDGEVVDPHIAVCIPNIPQQQGVADCGVYAIAYAFHAARGDDLEKMTFDQATMREHLARCFSRQKLTPFPHSQKNAGILYPRYPYQHVEVFCNCEMPECLDNMIQCDGCEEWFHMSCVGSYFLAAIVFPRKYYRSAIKFPRKFTRRDNISERSNFL